jgi:hypothetical protein
MLSFSKFLYLASITSSLTTSAFASVLDPVVRRSKANHDKYTHAHSLGDGYAFKGQDGWTALNLTNTRSPIRRSVPPSHAPHHIAEQPTKRTSGKKSTSKKNTSAAKTPADPKILSDIEPLNGLIDGVSTSLHPIGEEEDVTITWCVCIVMCFDDI